MSNVAVNKKSNENWADDARKVLFDYQRRAIEFIMRRGCCGLFLDMGLGKTLISLCAIKRLFDYEKIKKVLIVAPSSVVKTVWRQECEKWSFLNDVRVGLVIGTAKQREKVLKDYGDGKYDLVVISTDCLKWLINDTNLFSFDMLVIDESTNFKSPSSLRFKSLRRVRHKISRVVILTGTPSPNGLMDLWSQMYLVDIGERLGSTISQYRNEFFVKKGYMGYTYDIKDGSAKRISDMVQDVTLRLSSDDYLNLPDIIYKKEGVDIGSLTEYKKIEDEFVLELQDDKLILNSSAVLQKLLQYCNGFVYGEEGVVERKHLHKIKRLREIIDDNPDENVIVAYWYKEDLAMLQAEFKEGVVLKDNTAENVEKWNSGEIKMLFIHPASAGFGLNLQQGGNVIIWFSATWRLDLYQQTNARIHRQGQKNTVRVINMVASGCLDERIVRVVENKNRVQSNLLEGLKNDFISKN